MKKAKKTINMNKKYKLKTNKTGGLHVIGTKSHQHKYHQKKHKAKISNMDKQFYNILRGIMNNGDQYKPLSKKERKI